MTSVPQDSIGRRAISPGGLVHLFSLHRLFVSEDTRLIFHRVRHSANPLAKGGKTQKFQRFDAAHDTEA